MAVLTLGIGPWLGLAAAGTTAPAVVFASPQLPLPKGQVAPVQQATTPGLSRATGCSCREVVVEASNVVKNADIRTGDASVINRTITYIAPSYGDTDVEVEQDAEAITGDAVAGQVLAVNGGEGCSRVHVTATNIVEDSKLRTGDAVAKNRSLVLIDPSIPREDLEIEVDQEAVAKSGDAVAGQIIGVQGGGPCGGVILDALNRVRNVELQTGDAETSNISKILACKDVGCIDDIQLMLMGVDTVDVCDDEGCQAVPKARFLKMLKEQAENPPPPPADEDEDGDDRSSEPDDRSVEPLADNEKAREVQPWRFQRKPRQPGPARVEPTATPEPTPTPTPTPPTEPTV